MDTMPLDGKTAHHGGDVCVMCVSLAKSLPSGRVLFPPERTLCVKLLKASSLYSEHLDSV